MIIEILGLIFCFVVGTIGHFLYEWSGYKKYIGFWFSKNENVWEHMKLGITPILLWTIIELLTFNFNNLFFAKFASIVTFSFTLMILYYSYKTILKKNILFLDILIFYISISIAFYVSIKFVILPTIMFINFLSFVGLLFIIYLYYKFNRNTPNWFIFKNPN